MKSQLWDCFLHETPLLPQIILLLSEYALCSVVKRSAGGQGSMTVGQNFMAPSIRESLVERIRGTERKKSVQGLRIQEGKRPGSALDRRFFVKRRISWSNHYSGT